MEKSIRDRIVAMDFQYSGCIDYDSNSIQDENHDELCRNDYCRCSRMEFYINSIDRNAVAMYICENFGIVNERTISQIKEICKNLTDDDFECHVCGGYYGEETDGITLDNYQLITDIENVIDIKKARKKKLDMLKLSAEENELIKKILISEYGYLLDNLKDSEFAIIEVNTSDIIFPSKRHADNVGKKYLYSYRKHKICGIVREKGGKYLVIDGYHRITANLKSEKIKVILSN